MNFSCSQHLTSLPMSSYMLFGVVSKRSAGSASTNIPGQGIEESQPMSPEEVAQQEVKKKRMSRFKLLHDLHTSFTVGLQNSNDGIRPKDE